MGFTLRPQAEADIETIARHIAADSPPATLRRYDKILSACRQLGDMPGTGVARFDIRPQLRMLPVGNYLLLYRETEEGAEIVRVIHGAREWWKLL
ncbi:type II toxin-antitoxin system RelE/ParE family toxin [Mesorhizobium xinjiangense]|uniref:type II toxin-antitoxin system RelE/ParE family toxin n=1 Tax=Mesorhizobium xinjiangense TaxID=2678685 RepID=UPI0012EDA76E|nr:type II toxin-antitoxin system RelE/ParE family toxin [Mesorhizobium xinjiangense]